MMTEEKKAVMKTTKQNDKEEQGDESVVLTLIFLDQV